MLRSSGRGRKLFRAEQDRCCKCYYQQSETGRFGSSISDVLTAPNQFTAINGYYSGRNKPTQNTIDCAKRALNGEDNSNGAVYYYAPQYCGGSTASWFESLTFCMELDGQRYFK